MEILLHWVPPGNLYASVVFSFFFFSLRISFFFSLRRENVLRREKKKKLKVVNMLPVWRRMEYHSSHYQITYCMVIVTQ